MLVLLNNLRCGVLTILDLVAVICTIVVVQSLPSVYTSFYMCSKIRFGFSTLLKL